MAGEQSPVVAIALAWAADQEEGKIPKVASSDWESLNSSCPKRYFVGAKKGCIDRWEHNDQDLDIHKKLQGQAIWHFMNFVMEHQIKKKLTLKCDAYSGDLFVATRPDQKFSSDKNKAKYNREKHS